MVSIRQFPHHQLFPFWTTESTLGAQSRFCVTIHSPLPEAFPPLAHCHRGNILSDGGCQCQLQPPANSTQVAFSTLTGPLEEDVSLLTTGLIHCPTMPSKVQQYNNAELICREAQPLFLPKAFSMFAAMLQSQEDHQRQSEYFQFPQRQEKKAPTTSQSGCPVIPRGCLQKLLG